MLPGQAKATGVALEQSLGRGDWGPGKYPSPRLAPLPVGSFHPYAFRPFDTAGNPAARVDDCSNGVFGRAPAAKKAGGFREPLWAALSLVVLAILVVLLTKALQVVAVVTAYAVRTGIDAVGSVVAGIALFGEPAGATRLVAGAITVFGIGGLKLAG